MLAPYFMIRVLTSVALVALLAAGASADERKGLPTPDPRAKARLSVRWNPPSEWVSLDPRQGEFAAYRLQTTLLSHGRELTELGPRLVVHYLGPPSKRRELAARTKGWARRFLSPERKRLLPKDAKVRALTKSDPGLNVNLVEVQGDYSAVLAPGQEPRPPQRDWTGLYAHVVAADGVWAVVLLGPTKTTKRWTPFVETFLRASKSGTVLIRPDPREAPAKSSRAGATPASQPASKPVSPEKPGKPEKKPARPAKPAESPTSSPRDGAGGR